jgi:predicted transglutaminase-like cysteine proteinase
MMLRGIRRDLFCCTLLFSLGLSTSAALGQSLPEAQTAVPQSTPLPMGGETDMPSGYFTLCQANPEACNFETTGRARRHARLEKLTASRYRQLEEVTVAVNRSMHPIEDRRRFGVADRWTIGGTEGDCEDFAMTKRMRLIAKGWPASSVLVAIVSNSGEEHAVLVARTDHGDFVLDNLSTAVKPWQDTHYGWKKIQAPDDFAWRAL